MGLPENRQPHLHVFDGNPLFFRVFFRVKRQRQLRQILPQAGHKRRPENQLVSFCTFSRKSCFPARNTAEKASYRARVSSSLNSAGTSFLISAVLIVCLSTHTMTRNAKCTRP